MYRHIMKQQVVYGQFREYLELHNELNQAVAAKGYTPYVLMVPTVGTMNEAVIFADYDTLEHWQKDNDGFSSDADLMKIVRRQSEYVVQGSVSDQLYETIDNLA
jgi:hypothetical protein